jgi:hypothetical protein
MTKWNIRVQGYGTFRFDGTEAEAEAARINKARWEGGSSMKWRADLARESDRLRAEIAALFDMGKGAPLSLLRRLKKSTAKDTPTP